MILPGMREPSEQRNIRNNTGSAADHGKMLYQGREMESHLPVPDIAGEAYSLRSDFSLARLRPVWFTAPRNGRNA